MRSPQQLTLRVAGITLDRRDGRAVVLLVHDPSQHVVPVWMGDEAAAAVARGMQGRATSSATDTHALLVATIRALGARVEHVTLTAVHDGVLRAEVGLADATGSLILGARSSDAIVLALEANAPILADEEFVTRVAACIAEAEERVAARAPQIESAALTPAERWNQILAHLSSSRFSSTFEG